MANTLSGGRDRSAPGSSTRSHPRRWGPSRGPYVLAAFAALSTLAVTGESLAEASPGSEALPVGSTSAITPSSAGADSGAVTSPDAVLPPTVGAASGLAPQKETGATIGPPPRTASPATVVESGQWPIPGLVIELVAPEPVSSIPLTPPDHAGLVPVPSAIVVRSTGALSIVRVRLFDESDKLVPSDDEARAGTGFTYELRPVAPLQPGSRYELRIDGDSGHGPAAPSGLRYRPASVTFTTAGEKPAPPAVPKKKGRGKRRG